MYTHVHPTLNINHRLLLRMYCVNIIVSISLYRYHCIDIIVSTSSAVVGVVATPPVRSILTRI
jgi:hypothetical protein